MESITNAFSGNNAQSGNTDQTSSSSGGGIGDSINSALGGGQSSEKNEDYLDKGIDAVQQYGFGQGAQNNENAAEQFKDEQISDAIRGQYKNFTGSDVPIADK